MKRKYPPGPEMEAIEKLMNRRDELLAENQHLKGLLNQCYVWMSHLSKNFHEPKNILQEVREELFEDEEKDKE